MSAAESRTGPILRVLPPGVRRVVVSPGFLVGGAMLVVVLVLVLALSGSSSDAPAEGAGNMATVSMGEVFFIQRHPTTRRVEWLGTLLIWLLLALSAASIGLMIRYALESARSSLFPEELRARARTLLAESRVNDTLDFVRGDESYFARVLHAALREHQHGKAPMVRAGEQAGEERTVHLMRRIEPLNIIGNVSPMIGLFGTVYGMILAFREIVASGGTPDPVNLASGIGTALVTTFWGLVVAIPALAGYAVLRNRIDEITSQASREAEELINGVEAPVPERP